MTAVYPFMPGGPSRGRRILNSISRVMGLSADEQKLKLLRDHAEMGDARAQRLLALRLWRGRGVAQDWTEAARWMQRSAAQGLSLAQRDLGEFYQQGIGVARDDRLALQLYRAAAAQGDPIARRRLASFPKPAP